MADQLRLGHKTSPREVLDVIRVAYLEDRPIDVSHNALIRIAEDPGLRAEFEREFRLGNNDPALKRRLIVHLKDVVAELERTARSVVPWVEAMDRYVAPASSAVSVAGVVALLGVGMAAAPFLLIGGVTILGTCAFVRTRLTSGANQDTNKAAAVKRLIENLED